MFNLSQSGKTRTIQLNLNSPLRKLDPRTKLWMCLAISLTVMLPLNRLLLFLFGYLLLVIWARLSSEMVRQVWRLKWILIIIFVVDWWLVNLQLATIITLRLILLSGVFTIFFSTTATTELGLALERLGIPYRYAFSINLAFQSVGILQEEWHAIREAQQSRGIFIKFEGIKQLIKQLNNLIALTVPVIVLTTRRAWAITEAAYTRGFDSPHRQAYYQLKMKFVDWFVIFFFLIVIGLFIFWR